MKIAVCDDDRNIREQIASLIREQEPDAEIVTFEAGETMIKSQENFAVSFLDVEMKEILGLDVVNGTTILIYDTVPATHFWIPVICIMLLGTVIANAMLFQNVVQYHEGNRKRTMLENQIQQMHKEEFEERVEEMIREREMYLECFIEGNSIKVQK